MIKEKYKDLIQQTFEFPKGNFQLNGNKLEFHGLDLMSLIVDEGTPLKLSYLPNVSEHIQNAKAMFKIAMKELNYSADYKYCYCTKSSHFLFALKEALKNDIQLETSSEFDIHLIRDLKKKALVDKRIEVICNGFKPEPYKQRICELINDGWENVIPVLDHSEEMKSYTEGIHGKAQFGIRIATEEEPQFEVYTSRLGIRYSDVLSLYSQQIKPNPNFQLKMLHFFINTGIKDTAFYWNELHKAVELYCEMKRICRDLDSLNIGGGFPIQNSLGFNYDYQGIIKSILNQVKSLCEQEGVEPPNIYTEFGTYSVGESGAMIYEVLGQKQQNDRELWYILNSSLMTTIPDIFATGSRFILLPINQWDQPYQRVNVGGISCDVYDYYNSEVHLNELFLPKIKKGQPLYVGFFHVGAYQDALSGYGGIKHCLIPGPKHMVIDKNEKGEFTHTIYHGEQSAEEMMPLLGYEV